jgi:hypothetical protein
MLVDEMPSRLIAVSVVALAMMIMARATPAWSATTCPTTPGAQNTYMTNASGCSGERIEEDEERIEEELEVREDEEEERAITAERAAKAATDAAEEATEEAQEQAGQEEAASHVPSTHAALKLRVSVLTRREHSPKHLGETRISVTTSVPAQVKLVLLAHGDPVRLFRWKSTQGRKYTLSVPWTCHTQAGKYTFTVTADRENDGKPSMGDTIVRHRTFTIDAHATCSNQTPEERARE